MKSWVFPNLFQQVLCPPPCSARRRVWVVFTIFTIHNFCVWFWCLQLVTGMCALPVWCFFCKVVIEGCQDRPPLLTRPSIFSPFLIKSFFSAPTRILWFFSLIFYSVQKKIFLRVHFQCQFFVFCWFLYHFAFKKGSQKGASKEPSKRSSKFFSADPDGREEKLLNFTMNLEKSTFPGASKSGPGEIWRNKSGKCNGLA